MKVIREYLERKNKKNIPELWDNIWFKRNNNPYHNQVIASIKKLKGIKNVLEIGAGSGSDIIKLNEYYDVTYTDYSSIALEKFKKKTKKKIKAQLEDAKKLSFKNNSFDLVYCLGLLEHFSDEEKQIVIDEMKRVSKIYLLIDVPQKYSPHTILKKILMLIGKWPYGFEREFSFHELYKFLKKNNLKIIDYYGREILPIPRRFKTTKKIIEIPKIFAKFGCGCFGIICKKDKYRKKG